LSRADLQSFVLHYLPTPAARVLEVGCGRGQLARALADAGYDVVAIDPEAPEGAIFRNVTLEAFGDEGPFEAVVASRSLHHIHDLARGVRRISELLRPAGLLIVNEHAFERVDERTARWYISHSSDPEVPASPRAFLRWWADAHLGLHGSRSMRLELDRWFSEQFFAWRPYLYEELGSEAAIEEPRLIETGEIQATGFRFVGQRRT
jgi:SAM-dependent methyltransferase